MRRLTQVDQLRPRAGRILRSGKSARAPGFTSGMGDEYDAELNNHIISQTPYAMLTWRCVLLLFSSVTRARRAERGLLV